MSDRLLSSIVLDLDLVLDLDPLGGTPRFLGSAPQAKEIEEEDEIEEEIEDEEDEEDEEEEGGGRRR